MRWISAVSPGLPDDPTVEDHDDRTTTLRLVPQRHFFQFVQGPLNVQSRTSRSGICAREQRPLPILEKVKVQGFAQSHADHFEVGVPYRMSSSSWAGHTFENGSTIGLNLAHCTTDPEISGCYWKLRSELT